MSIVNFAIPDLLSWVSNSDSRSNCCRRRSVGIWATSPSMREHADLGPWILNAVKGEPRSLLQSNEGSNRL